MLSINVTNPTIQQLLLAHLIETIDSQDGMDALIQMGCSEAFIDAIRHRQARDLINVVKSLKTMQFTISTTEILSQLQHLDRRRHDAQLQEYFVMHGASRTMLSEFFKMSADEVRRMRELLLPEGAAHAGRTSLPAPQVRDQIHQAWHTINVELSSESRREQFYRLHQQFPTLTIHALAETVDEFDDKNALTRKPGRATPGPSVPEAVGKPASRNGRTGRAQG